MDGFFEGKTSNIASSSQRLSGPLRVVELGGRGIYSIFHLKCWGIIFLNLLMTIKFLCYNCCKWCAIKSHSYFRFASTRKANTIVEKIFSI